MRSSDERLVATINEELSSINAFNDFIGEYIIKQLDGDKLKAEKLLLFVRVLLKGDSCTD
jgi:hypothetical protein